MYFIYNLGMVIIWILQIPIMIYRMAFKKGVFKKVKSYLEIIPKDVKKEFKNKDVIWIHMASVGETVAAKPIVEEIKRRNPFVKVLVSCITIPGQSMAKKIITNADAYIYFPFDVPCFIRRVLKSLKPKAVILIETELWPNLLRLTANEKIPVYLMNGRISENSLKWYMMIRKFISKYFYNIRKFCMISKEDAEHIIKLGANPQDVQVTGNTKCEKTYNKITQDFANEWKNILKIKENTFLIVAGSTHSNEEKTLCRMLQKIETLDKKVKMIVAIRDINRAKEVEKIFKNARFKVMLRTKMQAQDDCQVIILDTIGELSKLYALADIVFIGGSLVPVGGHNLLEAAQYGKPIIVGKNMFNFKEIHKIFVKEKACLTVNDENELIQSVNELLSDEEKVKELGKAALKVVNENIGAAVKNIDIFEATINEN